MILSESATRFVDLLAPEHDAIQDEMATVASRENFPIIGRAAGGLLAVLAATRDAKSVFEFGSGFGYSATWFLRGMNPKGEIVMTEMDGDELAMGREFLERAGVTDRVHFEHGDALEIVDRYDGPFDVVLIDHRKTDYREAFELAAPKVAPGGIVIADNMMSGPVDIDDVLGAIETTRSGDEDESVRGIVSYVKYVWGLEDWQSTILPIGQGLAVSVKLVD